MTDAMADQSGLLCFSLALYDDWGQSTSIEGRRQLKSKSKRKAHLEYKREHESMIVLVTRLFGAFLDEFGLGSRFHHSIRQGRLYRAARPLCRHRVQL